MTPAVVTSLIYIKARKAIEIFSPTIRKLWKDWELRILVLLSLSLQIILIFFGKRRKYMSKVWIRFLLWSAYLMADWVATVALGVLLNNMGDVYEEGRKAANLDADTQLTAFWAPFLLLHLGGPDAITAYALEDNELWLRHFLGLGVQTGVAVCIFLLAWTASRFSILTMPMLLAGIIKYGERTWALRSASNEELRDSMLTAPDPGPNYSKFMEEFTLKQYEGFYAMAEEVLESQAQVDVSAREDDHTIKDAPELRKAHFLFKTFKRLFVDLILSFQDRDNSQSLFKDITSENAFRVIAIELGFMYDMLYTKGKVIYSRNGCYLRFISLTSTCIVLVFFSLYKTHGCAKIDIAITFLLLIIAIILELYALLLVLSSDWTDLYLSKHEGVLRQVITRLRLPKRPRWSKSLAQYSLLSYSLKSKPVVNSKIQKLFSIDNILEHLHMTTERVGDDLETFIFNHLKKKFQDLKAQSDDGYAKKLKDLCMCRGARALKGFTFDEELRWSVEVEFDQGILIWHIATDLCYHSDHEAQNDTNRKISNSLSKYMLYLLVMRSTMLPMGIGKIRYQDTCAEATRFFEKHESILGTIRRSQNLCNWVFNLFRKGNPELKENQEACEVLLKVNTVVPPAKVKGDRSKSVLFDACRLASQLQNIPNKWEVMGNVWVEMLAYAASHCRGTYHAQQLGRGGELLTHVWLLMAHFGLTEQFQISHGHARAKLTVR
ncbi:uncharacterized protein LOC8278883 [Ricinus communis]|nr:uncharacterized protein LOC8278883 [Ricinus communis]